MTPMLDGTNQDEESQDQRLPRHGTEASDDLGDQDDDDNDDNEDSDSFGMWDTLPFLSALFGSFSDSSEKPKRQGRKTRWFGRLKDSFRDIAHLAGTTYRSSDFPL